MNMENYKSLESNLSGEKASVISIVQEYYETSNSALINEACENDIAAVQYAQYLTSILFDEPGDEQWSTVYRAFQFALEINELAGISFDRLPIREDFSGVQTVHELREKLTEDANEFMSRNESLDTVTGYFMAEIDPHQRNSAEAEIVVALISRQMERRQQELLAEYEINNWDGQISDLDQQ